MPEGDTVWLAGRRLHEALAGRALTVSDFRVPRLATVDLTGRSVLEVVSRGKHLLTRVEGGLTLHTHLRMDGAWHLYRSPRRRRGGPEWQIRVVLANLDWQAVGYRLPVVDLLPSAEENRVVGHLGPDLLGAWDLTAASEAVRRIQEAPQRAVAEALLDQRNLAGIGNLYANEVCFLAGVSPWTPVSDVAELPGMVERARALLAQNRDHWQQVTTGDPRRGHSHWVFERSGRPCRRCGSVVRRAEIGPAPRQRLAYWCPACQPGPAPPPRRHSGPRYA